MPQPDATLQLRLTGARFDSGSLPLDFLGDLTALGDALKEAAKASYRSRHPNRKSVPKGFTDNINLGIVAFKQDSLALSMQPIAVGNSRTAESRPLLPSEFPYLNDAWEAIVADISLEAPESPLITGACRNKLKRFGASFRDDETAELNTASGQRVTYHKAARRQYLNAGLREQRYTALVSTPEQRNIERATLRGMIHGVNSKDAAFYFTGPDGIPVPADTPENFRPEIREAWLSYDQGNPVYATITGEMEYNWGGLVAIRNITNIKLLHPRTIERQIESLKNLPARRLEDGAKPIDPEGLEWLRQSLLTRIAFDDTTMPYLYPTEEGNVQAEWTIGRFRADLEIRLDNHQALWGYSDLSSDYDDEREIDLNLESEWQWLSNTLQQWAQEASQ